MSSLAATQADGYYLPPEYYESGAYKKNKSKNEWYAMQQKRQGQAVAQKDDKKQQIVRFELPYDGLCQLCECYISRGTRYNASKEKVDMYFTSPIYEFRMTCRSCSGITSERAKDPTESDSTTKPSLGDRMTFVIRTNPQQQSFDYIAGITKLKFKDSAAINRTANDPKQSSVLDDLERHQEEKKTQRTEIEQLQELQTINRRIYSQDADGNAIVRNQFRTDRKRRKAALQHGKRLGWRKGMAVLPSTKPNGIPMTDASDEVTVRSAVFGDGHEAERQRYRNVRASSIFSKPSRRNTDSQGRKRRNRAHERSTAIDNEDADREIVPDTVVSRHTSRSAGTSKKRRRKGTAEVETVDLTTPTVPPRKEKLILAFSFSASSTSAKSMGMHRDGKSTSVVATKPLPIHLDVGTIEKPENFALAAIAGMASDSDGD